MTETEKKVVLVTGGSGLVGSGIKAVVEEEARTNETWVFLSSKVELAIPVIFFHVCYQFLFFYRMPIS